MRTRPSPRWSWIAAGSFLFVGCGGASPPAATEPAAPVHGDHGHGGHHHPEGVHHDFKDAAAWSKEFDDPARDAWQKPDEVVSLLAIAPGMVVADVGAGTGYFEGRLDRAVGDAGKVLALDVEPDMITFMQARATRDGWKHVEAKVVAPDDPALAVGTVHRVLVVDTWHHLGDRVAYAKKLAAALAAGGTVTIVDFTQETDKGPPRQHRLTTEQVMADLKAAGLEPRVVEETLPDQYVVVGAKR
jgi:ubiquinone/menaquinone biosynthesis C-methylase UbiE